MINLDKYIIDQNSSISDLSEKIETNHKGMVIVINKNFRVIGIITSGDIRRKVLFKKENIALKDFVNRKYIFCNMSDSREKLLKAFDSGIEFIPILDSKKKLIDIIFKDNLDKLKISNKIYRAKSPVRISFAGGGSDVTSYFIKNKSSVINASISLFAYCSLIKKKENIIEIFLHDQNKCLTFRSLDHLLKKKKLNLIESVISIIKPKFGFELHLRTDFPISSGLGGSSALSSAIFSCFNETRTDKWNRYDISELSYQAERLVHNVSGGWQDQYASSFGGINFIEFTKSSNFVQPIILDQNLINELEEQLVLFKTDIKRQKKNIHKKINIQKVHKFLKINSQLAIKIKNDLLKGKISEFGHFLNQSWENKKKTSKDISNKKIDFLYNKALSIGALGGKLLGAGNGGYFLFVINPVNKSNFIKELELFGLKNQKFNFDFKGTQSWSTIR